MLDTMNPPSTDSLWRRLAQVFCYYSLLFILVLPLLTGLGTFIGILLIPLLWLCARPNFVFRPKLPEQDFTNLEWSVWFGGAAICPLIVVGCAYGAGTRDPFKFFQAVAVAVTAWAFLFLAFRDCRRTIHQLSPPVGEPPAPTRRTDNPQG